MLKISVTANTPTSKATKLRPSISSKLPKVYLWAPVIISIPTVPAINPKIAEINPFTKFFELNPATAINPIIPTRKNSGAEILSAILANGIDKKIKTKPPTNPPIKEDVKEYPKAFPGECLEDNG